jgi:hypothetical protein
MFYFVQRLGCFESHKFMLLVKKQPYKKLVCCNSWSNIFNNPSVTKFETKREGLQAQMPHAMLLKAGP